ncbi:MAG: hypothetical protein FJ098_10140, partial [Deltaproteobacteria bacterium]|nr:hypothetical protein [Deltaproteobacteria bacterium]
WWQGDTTGNVILTAFGMMMLRDTQAVYPAVDDGVIDRAFRFLAAQQQPDGFWGEDRHLHAGNENLGAGRLRSTCYIAWALAASGYGDDPVTRKALDGIAATAGGEEDLYTLGVCANALALTGRKGAALERILDRTARAAVREGERLHWEPGGMTLVQSGGIAAQVEVTALLALAWVAAGYHLEDVAAVVDWLAASKDPQGNWGYNTQATVLALKVFLAAARLETGSTDARVRVLLDGRELGARLFDEFNRDVLWQVEIPQEALGSARTLTLELAGTGNLGYQVVTGHHVPWGGEEAPARALDIEVSWDRKLLSVDDTVRARVRVQRNDEEARGAVLLTLGIPPGFDLLGEDLDGLRTERVIRSWESTGRQLILYLDELPLGRGVQLEYRLRARMPVKAATGGAEARLYYRADVRAVQAPGDLEVR